MFPFSSLPSRLLTAFLSLCTLALAQSNATAQDATTFALLYGSPLLAFDRAASPLASAVGANNWHHARQLFTADDRLVVSPNADTLVSLSHDRRSHRQ